ncbi:MAG: SpoIID/LytB domain-containing protein [Lachnospiraceae bacterium]|nr:SpoIID/LytB domain-containing protein [Lachnospiraceae bacterium]
MRHKKVIGRLVTALEVVLLAGMVLLFFYLLFQYMEEGEQAVNGTAVEIETDGSEEDLSAEKEVSVEEDSECSDPLVQPMGEDSVLIRVRILDDDYEKDLFEKITVTAVNGFTVEWGTYDDAYNFKSGGEREEESETFTEYERDERETAAVYETYESFMVTTEELQTGEALRLIPGDGGTIIVTSLTRADGSPAYEGELYIYRLEGGLALVNVLDLEEYLYAVVSSEMPSYFPIEALKAQAVCARTFALLCMEDQKNKKSMADLDDSVRFQVYNNREATDTAREVVDATCQMILTLDEIQYYSTSCLSEHLEDLNEEQAFRRFLAEIPDEGAEYGSAWVRWETEIPVSQVLEWLADTYGVQADTLEKISVESRTGNGQVQLLQITAGGETVEIEGEYAIRQFLSPAETDVKLMDGTIVSGLQLLPSAFFWMEIEAYSSDGKNLADESFSDSERISGDENLMDNEEISGNADEILTDREGLVDDMAAEGDMLHIYGGGYGHGKGMSQYGAAQMAAEGASYLEILEYYYSGSD